MTLGVMICIYSCLHLSVLFSPSMSRGGAVFPVSVLSKKVPVQVEAADWL